MTTQPSEQRTFLKESTACIKGYAHEVEYFLLDLTASHRQPSTLRYYTQKLTAFGRFLAEQGINTTANVTPQHLRLFMQRLAADHNSGGVLSYYRALKTFFRFLEREEFIERDPLRHIRPPKVDMRPLDPVNLDHLHTLIESCPKTPTGLRDRSLLLTLLDTGIRAQEACNLNVGNFDWRTGSLIIRTAKNHQPRTVFVGQKTRRALVLYLRTREDLTDEAPLWLAHPIHKEEPGRFTYDGLRTLLHKLARAAGVPCPSLHSFRRGFAINMLRSGADPVTISRMLGHGSLPVVLRYLKQESADLAEVHKRHSPVDRLL